MEIPAESRDAGVLSPWASARADGGSAEGRLGALKAEVEVLLAAFCEKELEIEAIDCAMSGASDLVSISRSVAGLGSPVECSVRDAELVALCDALFGASACNSAAALAETTQGSRSSSAESAEMRSLRCSPEAACT